MYDDMHIYMLDQAVTPITLPHLSVTQPITDINITCTFVLTSQITSSIISSTHPLILQLVIPDQQRINKTVFDVGSISWNVYVPTSYSEYNVIVISSPQGDTCVPTISGLISQITCKTKESITPTPIAPTPTTTSRTTITPTSTPINISTPIPPTINDVVPSHVLLNGSIITVTGEGFQRGIQAWVDYLLIKSVHAHSPTCLCCR